jgi:hypothetical protein
VAIGERSGGMVAGFWDLRGVRVLKVVVVVGYWVLKEESVNLEGLLLNVKGFVLRVERVEVEGYVRVAIGVSFWSLGITENVSVFEDNSGYWRGFETEMVEFFFSFLFFSFPV